MICKVCDGDMKNERECRCGHYWMIIYEGKKIIETVDGRNEMGVGYFFFVKDGEGQFCFDDGGSPQKAKDQQIEVIKLKKLTPEIAKEYYQKIKIMQTFL